jgi:hypothetical protein
LTCVILMETFSLKCWYLHMSLHGDTAKHRLHQHFNCRGSLKSLPNNNVICSVLPSGFPPKNLYSFLISPVCKLQRSVYGVWLVAFTATLYNKIFPGYQPCQLVKWRKN